MSSSFSLSEYNSAHLEIITDDSPVVCAKGGVIRFILFTPSDFRFVVKVKCSNNRVYRVKPVYTFVEPNGERVEITIRRYEGPESSDKFCFYYDEAPEKATDPKKAFPKSDPGTFQCFQIDAINKC